MFPRRSVQLESQRWPQSHFFGLGHQTALWLILLWSVTYILTMSTYRDKGHNLLLSLMREWNKESLQSNKLLLFCVTYLLHFWFGMFYYAHKVTVWLWDINAWFYSQKGEDNSNWSLWHLQNVCNLHNPYKMPPTECWPLHDTIKLCTKCFSKCVFSYAAQLKFSSILCNSH